MRTGIPIQNSCWELLLFSSRSVCGKAFTLRLVSYGEPWFDFALWRSLLCVRQRLLKDAGLAFKAYNRVGSWSIFQEVQTDDFSDRLRLMNDILVKLNLGSTTRPSKPRLTTGSKDPPVGASQTPLAPARPDPPALPQPTTRPHPLARPQPLALPHPPVRLHLKARIYHLEC